MNNEVERQQLLELMSTLTNFDPKFINWNALNKQFNKVFEITTERQRTLGRLLGRKPEDFIP